MYSTTARPAPARVGQALVSNNSPLREEKERLGARGGPGLSRRQLSRRGPGRREGGGLEDGEATVLDGLCGVPDRVRTARSNSSLMLQQWRSGLDILGLYPVKEATPPLERARQRNAGPLPRVSHQDVLPVRGHLDALVAVDARSGTFPPGQSVKSTSNCRGLLSRGRPRNGQDAGSTNEHTHGLPPCLVILRKAHAPRKRLQKHLVVPVWPRDPAI